MTQELRYVPEPAEVAYTTKHGVQWDVPKARRPEAPRFCQIRGCGQSAPHEYVQWYTEAYRRSFRVMARCDAHAPKVEIIDHDLEALLG